MVYRNYGNKAEKISILGLGTLRFGRIRENDSKKMGYYLKLIERAMELGINYIDTAAMLVYGTESLIGHIKDRSKLFISTKNHYKGTCVNEWEKILNNSLKNLGTSYIDFYHLHDLRWDEYRNKLLPSGIIDRLKELKKEGILHNVCFSSHDTGVNIEKIIQTGIFDGLLVQYNIIDRENEGILRIAKQSGMGVGIMGPAGGGRFMELSYTIKEKYGLDIDIPKLALKFVLSNPYVDFALTGVSTLEMLEQNVNTVCHGINLTDEEKTVMDFVSAEFGSEEYLRCTGCGYCMPCHKKVDIPANLKIMKYIKKLGLKEEGKKLYLLKMKHANFKSAHSCVGCRVCEKKCPQKISIFKQLNELKQMFDKGDI